MSSPLPGVCKQRLATGHGDGEETPAPGWECATSLCNPTVAYQDQASSKEILIAPEPSAGLGRGWLQR